MVIVSVLKYEGKVNDLTRQMIMKTNTPLHFPWKCTMGLNYKETETKQVNKIR